MVGEIVGSGVECVAFLVSLLQWWFNALGSVNRFSKSEHRWGSSGSHHGLLLFIKSCLEA